MNNSDYAPLDHLLTYPLLNAIFGRRARRSGLGMEIPSGPLAFRSRHPPLPLSELERSVLLAVGTGITGWNFGVPFGPDRPREHAHYTVRYTGRAALTAGGFGTPVMLFTDDEGTYLTNTRDIPPSKMRGFDGIQHDAERILAVTGEHTVKLTDRRLDLPAAPPHMLEPNLWMANAPGSTLFMAIADASEQVLALLAMAIGNGNVIMDDEAGQPAGDLDPFIRSGFLDESKLVPMSVLQQMAYEANCSELAFMAHNIALTMQAAVDAFVARKFGQGGAYDPATPGPWKRTAEAKESVRPYGEEFVSCLGEVAQYIYDKYGKFPGAFTTIVLTGFVQAVHLDTEFYDRHYQEGAYLDTHADHMQRWHRSAG